MNTTKPGILLHICCAPCSPHVVRVLSERFDVHGYFFNPNIQPEEEYRLREAEIARFAQTEDFPLTVAEYDIDGWNEIAKGLETEPEGGRRCEACFRMRLKKTAAAAREFGIPFFTTTLTVAPMKKASVINRIGMEIARESGIEFFEADFKKKNGFKISCDLSRDHGFYRQNYCGCIHSRRDIL